MRNKKKDKTSGHVTLVVLSVICVAMIAVSLWNTSSTGPVRQITGIVVTPLQKGINSLGVWFSGFTSGITDVASLREQNQILKEKVDTLEAENSQLVLDKEELARLQELLALDQQYSNYKKTGARVISKESGNWFNNFTIDKGSKDGIKVNANVIAGSGLVGIVTSVGPNWATVRSIIDDQSNVSAMISTTSDTCIIEGSLEMIDAGTLRLVKLSDENNKVHVGDKVVTSNISEKYLPGILIGYISELSNDPNNLTKSGEVTPVVDFRHLQEVLVILELKEYVASTDDAQSSVINDLSDTKNEQTQTPVETKDLLTAPRA